ncbi:MAG: heparinase II/III family protein [Verrucomicrobia bacterium]|nr:heparinase II/III family protein [Verrucomicrobiota bacterium]
MSTLLASPATHLRSTLPVATSCARRLTLLVRCSMALGCGLIASRLGLAAPGTAYQGAAAQPPPRLAYDPAAYELASFGPAGAKPWSQRDLQQAILDRAAHEKRRRELDVYYYRIGYTIAFRLPVAKRPTREDVPVGIANTTYPWLIWLSWDLEDRWRTLHAAWRSHGDREAGLLLQRELAALAGWDQFVELNNQTGLVTAHVAASLSLALADANDWEPALLQQARAAATALIERDAWPWFAKYWSDAEAHTPRRLHNIPVIALARAAQLARVLGSPRAEDMEKKMADVLRTWCRFRTGQEYHTEGTAYDGYLMDSVTEWMAGLPSRAELLRECRDAFRSLADEWIDLTLPGRPDLHAPVGDVEPEMMFWSPALVRLAAWSEWRDAAWLLSGVPVNRLPTAAVSAAREHAALFASALTAPVAAPREHPHAVTLRTGWSARDVATVVSLTRNTMGHLQADGGHLVLGWQGRFWITDPGYRQYRRGEEQTYTLGPEAHNCPVIDGQAQKKPASRLLDVDTDERGWQHAGVDLTACYAGLPAGALVRRDVWQAPGDGAAVVVRDWFRSLRPAAEIRTHWLGGTHLAWTFVRGWVRLSDGERALWLGTPSGGLVPSALNRHPGSRGPLTLTHTAHLGAGEGVRWWVLWCDPEGGWTPPTITPDGERLLLAHPARPGVDRAFGGGPGP